MRNATDPGKMKADKGKTVCIYMLSPLAGVRKSTEKRFVLFLQLRLQSDTKFLRPKTQSVRTASAPLL